MALRVGRVLVPDEFAARHWRQFTRPRGWKGFPLPFLIVVFGCCLTLGVVIRGTGMNFDYLPHFALVIQSALPLFAAISTAAIWWGRPSTQSTLEQLAVTPFPPARYVLSSLLPGRWILLILMVALSIFIFYHSDKFGGEVSMFLAAVPVHLLQGWMDLPIALALMLSPRSFSLGVALSAVVLIPLHFFMFISVVVVGFDVEIINSEEDFVIGQICAALVYLCLYGMYRLYLSRRIERRLAQRFASA